MSFGNNLQMDGAHRVRQYGDAIMAWRQAATWRHEDDSHRVLTNRKCKNKMIINRGGSISFRLFSTDVVTYHPDGEVTINPYQSCMTDTFANYFLPDGVRGNFNQSMIVIQKPRKDDETESYHTMWETSRYYKANRTLQLRRIEGDYPWEVIKPEPWKKYSIDRPKMREACKEWGYDLFSAAALGYFGIQGHTGRTFKMHQMRDALKVMKEGPSAWSEFLTNPEPSTRRRAYESGPPYVLSTLMTMLRKAIADDANAYTVEELPFVVGYKAWMRVR